MKSINTLFCAAACAAMTLGATKASADSLPLASLAITGSIIYNTNDTVDSSTTTLKAQQASFTGKDLINLLTSSSDVSNTVVDVTGSNGIPAGSFLVLNTDLGNGDLIVSNKSGFSFPLRGFDLLAVSSYDYGSIRSTKEAPMVSSFSLTNKPPRFSRRTLPATETDNLLVEFSFDDSNGESFDVFGKITFGWTAGTPSDDSRPVTAIFSLSGTGAGEVNGFDGIATVSITGKGTGNELLSDEEFPFFIWWND